MATKEKPVVKYLAPVDPELQLLGRAALIELSYTSPEAAQKVGLEILRRAQKNAIRKEADPK